MPSQKLKLIMLCLISIVGCKRDFHDANQSIDNFIKQAEDEKYSLEKRLFYAIKADSIASSTKDATIKLNAKRTLAGLNLLLCNLAPAETGFLKVAEIATRLSDFENLGIAYNNLAIIFDKRGAYDSALKYYNKAILNFNRDKNKLQIARAMVNIGIVLLNEENYDDAYKISWQAAKMLDSLNAEDELASIYITIGIILREQHLLENALSYFQSAGRILKKENDSAGVATVLVNIGDVYLKKEQYAKALNYYRESLQIKQSLGLSNYTGAVLEDLSEVHSSLGNFDSAEEYCKRALVVWTANDDKEGILLVSNQQSKIYLKENNLVKAQTLATHTQKIFPKSGFLKQKLENHLILYEVFSKLKQNDSAIKYASSALALKDSLYNSDMAANIARMDAKYRNHQIQKELLLSQQLQKWQSTEIRTQRNFIVILSIFLLLLVIFSVLLYRFYSAIKVANKRIETLMKELNHRVKNNLQIVKHLLKLQLRIAKDENQVMLVQSSMDRVDAMNGIHTLLYNKGFTGTINLKAFIESLVSNLAFTYQDRARHFKIKATVQDMQLDIDKAIPVGLIVNELISNIFKYAVTTNEESFINLIVTEENNICKLVLADNCKRWDIQGNLTKKTGLGLFLVETFVKQLKGNWNPGSDENGTSHTIEFRK